MATMTVQEKRRHMRRSRNQTSADSDSDEDTFLPSGHTSALSALPHPALDRIGDPPPLSGSPVPQVLGPTAQATAKPATQALPELESILPLKCFPTPPPLKRRSVGDFRVTRDVVRKTERSCSTSIVDGLLFEIYDGWSYCGRGIYDSDTTYTEYSSTSDALGRSHLAFTDKHDHAGKLSKKFLQTKDLTDLRQMNAELQHRVTQHSARLIRQLKNRDRRLAKVNRHCDILTAILQASSPKRRIDSQIKFSIEPLSGEDTFNQWRDAMKAVARLPLGIPPEFRKKVWLALADNHIRNLKVDWEQTRKLAFNERSNPDDNKLGMQIVKDLHRTGCSGFSGTNNDQDRAILKRVLLAYARWNKKVGYCQGFNVLAALILDVMNRKEDDALKVMIYLVDHVLPGSYFANNLRALSVDMAVFRDLLYLKVPKLSKHLDHLQAAARDVNTGANYEPPLTNVFTMQWFLTMFATCLPKNTALRVWDSVILEGSEILLRTAVAIWGKLQKRIMNVQSADEFYTTMGTLTNDILDLKIVDADSLIKMVYAMAPLPFPQLTELREKYTYNITPFTAAMSTGQRPHKTGTNIFSDDDDFDDDDFAENINCFTGIFPAQVSPSRRGLGDMDKSQSGSSFDISKVSPGAYAAQPEVIGPLASAYAERMSLDIDQLNKQYRKLRQRQNQAHIILSGATAKHANKSGPPTKLTQKTKQQVAVAPIQSPMAVNHLFIGRQLIGDSKRNKAVAQAPNIAPFYPKTNFVSQCDKTDEYQFRIAKSGMVAPGIDGSRSPGARKFPGCSWSIDSSESGNSTLQSSQHSDSVSDVSTFGLDSELGQSDIDSSFTQDMPDLIDLEEEKGETVNDGFESPDAMTQHDESSDTSTDVDLPTVQEVGKVDKTKDNSQTGADESETDISMDSKVSNVSNIKETSSSHHRTSLQDESKMQAPDFDIPKDNDELLACAASNMCKTQIQSRNGIVQGNTNSSNSSHTNAEIVTSGNLSNDLLNSPVRSSKLFNPFPGQHVNSRRMQNGVKLGLYSATTAAKLETGIAKPFGMKHIGRSQINQCLHRQYMAEIKQKARGSNS